MNDISTHKEDNKMKQVIIARRDLNMSPGKLAAQVSHASMAFLTIPIQENAEQLPNGDYSSTVIYDQDVFEDWLKGAFTKVVLAAKTKGQFEKAIRLAKENGMIEGKDFFVIRDSCLTELTPENIDENTGRGWTATCIGFRPMYASEIDTIGKKFQLMK